MNPRRLETTIAWFTLGALVIYIPGETYVSWPELWHPFYLVDFIAMVLLLWGAVHSLRARPLPVPGLLCAAYGWAASNGWRATFWRLAELRAGGQLDYGNAEAWIVGCASAIALVCFVILLVLTASNEPPRG
ncbi:MAG: hypothetical protein L0Y42_09955 [Phycisphaerales bacterium]|nr:hypothetical protein [Phycisphaerales bacterium]